MSDEAASIFWISDASDSEATRLAQREVDGFRRRLRRHGVNDRALILRVRKSAEKVWTIEGKAWPHDAKEPQTWLLSAPDSEPPPAGRESHLYE